MDIERYLGDTSDAILSETETSTNKDARGDGSNDAKLLAILWTSTMQGVKELTDTRKLLERELQELELEQKNEIKQISMKPFIRIT